MTDQTTQENQQQINITFQQLNTIVSGVLVAQKRGAYTLEESGILAESVRSVTQFIKITNERVEANARVTAETETATQGESDDESEGPQLVISEKQ